MLDVDRDGRISTSDLSAYLSSMGYKTSKNEAEDMIWEHDEDCDGHIAYTEFLQMYHRCKDDAHGNEPRQLYNVALFAMHAQDGVVPIEEAMKMMHLRVGSEALESQLQALYGTSDATSGMIIPLKDFIKCLQKQLIMELQSKSRPPYLANK